MNKAVISLPFFFFWNTLCSYSQQKKVESVPEHLAYSEAVRKKINAVQETLINHSISPVLTDYEPAVYVTTTSSLTPDQALCAWRFSWTGTPLIQNGINVIQSNGQRTAVVRYKKFFLFFGRKKYRLSFMSTKKIARLSQHMYVRVLLPVGISFQ